MFAPRVNFKPEIFNTVYIPLFKDQKRFLVLYGGAGSGKSVFAAQKILIRMLQSGRHRFLFVRKVARTIRRSQYQLFKDSVYAYGLGGFFTFRDGDLSCTCINGSEFFSAGIDDPEKIKSITNITGMWIEEATELTANDFNQLNLRLRGQTRDYKQIILTFNPISAHNWAVVRFVMNRPDTCTVLKTIYKDNRFIDEEYKRQLEDLINQDENMARIYAQGEPGILTNLVYPKPYKIITEWPDNEDKYFDDVFYGLDFGYTNPSALIKIGVKDFKSLYMKQLLYDTGLITPQLIKRLESLIRPLERNRPIYCDSANPDKIDELVDAGFDAIPCYKGLIADGVDFVKRFKLYSFHENDDLHKEKNGYVWRSDKNGDVVEPQVPVKYNDHLMDAKRYAIHTHFKDYVDDPVEVTTAEVR